MAIVLGLVGGIIFQLVGKILRNNAQDQVEQIIIQASARMDAIHAQIDQLSLQVMTHDQVQQTGLTLLKSESISYDDKLYLRRVVNQFLTFSDSIHFFEIYDVDLKPVLNETEQLLDVRINENWIIEADEGEGKLVFIGADQGNAQNMLAIRQISLREHSFAKGGYLLMEIHREYFQLVTGDQGENQFGLIKVIDHHGSIITETNPYSQSDQELTSKQQENNLLTLTHESPLTNWVIQATVPLEALTRELPHLIMPILLSAIVGVIIFSIAALGLSTMITKPISRLSHKMEKASEGEWESSVEVSPIVEISNLNHSYNKLVYNTNYLVKAVYEKELRRNQSELKALQAQINPHFLFNTLNAFYWSLEEKGEEQLAETVITMSELFRYTIDQAGDKQWVTLDSELQHINRYLDIMKIRKGDQFTWNIKCDESFRKVKIPKLMIQPLVENSILHGIENRVGLGIINLSINPSEDRSRLIILVEDNGKGINEVDLHHLQKELQGQKPLRSKTSMGLTNINSRLQLYYGCNFYLTIESINQKGTRVSFPIKLN